MASRLRITMSFNWNEMPHEARMMTMTTTTREEMRRETNSGSLPLCTLRVLLGIVSICHLLCPVAGLVSTSLAHSKLSPTLSCRSHALTLITPLHCPVRFRKIQSDKTIGWNLSSSKNAQGLLEERDRESEDESTRKQTTLLNAGVGGVVLAGGIAGFVTKGSKVSLIAGSTFGGLLLLSAVLIGKFKRPSIGYKLAGAVSGLLSYVMGKKYFSSGSYIPAGFVATLAVITFVFNSVDALVASGAVDDEE